jgi:hypothetical protein
MLPIERFVCICSVLWHISLSLQSLFPASLTSLTLDLEKIGVRTEIVVSILSFAALTGSCNEIFKLGQQNNVLWVVFPRCFVPCINSAEPDVSDTLHSHEEQSLAALAISRMIFSGRRSRGATAANFNIGAAPEPARFTKEEDLLKWYSGNDVRTERGRRDWQQRILHRLTDRIPKADYAIDDNTGAKQLTEEQAEALKDTLIMNEDTVRQV